MNVMKVLAPPNPRGTTLLLKRRSCIAALLSAGPEMSAMFCTDLRTVLLEVPVWFLERQDGGGGLTVKTFLITFGSITRPIINRCLHGADLFSPVPNHRAICSAVFTAHFGSAICVNQQSTRCVMNWFGKHKNTRCPSFRLWKDACGHRACLFIFLNMSLVH